MAAFSKADKILTKSLYECKGYNAPWHTYKTLLHSAYIPARW